MLRATISELTNLKQHHFLFALFVLGGTLFSGLLFLFYFDKTLFIELDVIKLVLLSVAITLPLLIVNVLITLCVALFAWSPDLGNDLLKLTATVPLLSTCVVLVSLFVVTYFLNLSLRQAIVSGLMMDVVFVLGIFTGIELELRKHRKSPC